MQRKTKPWRKVMAATIAAGVGGALLAGCGGGSDGAQTTLGKNDTLSITTFGDFGYSDLISKWNADPASPFQVKETKIAQWDTWKQTLTSNLQAGTGLSDVVAIEGDAMPQFLTEGASEQFADLTDHALDNRWVSYKYKDGQTADGKQIGYPTDAGPEAICYRADLFRQAGFPTDRADVAKMFGTWDSYFDAGQKFVAKVPATKLVRLERIGRASDAQSGQIPVPDERQQGERRQSGSEGCVRDGRQVLADAVHPRGAVE